MNLQNGYKVIYEKAADGKRTFYASKTGVFADAEVIAEAIIGKYKLIYEKAGQFYGSETGIPTAEDYCFTEFDKVFKATEEDPKDEVVNIPTGSAGSDETNNESVESPENGPTYDLPTFEEEDEE